MIKWELQAGDQPALTRATGCVLDPGVLDSLGDQISHPLVAALGVLSMKIALAAVIEAIFVVLGKPDLEHRQCLLAMDKWLNLIVAEHQLVLGLIWNTRRLTIAIPREYLDDTLCVCVCVVSRWKVAQVERLPEWFRTQTSFGAHERPFSGPWLAISP